MNKELMVPKGVCFKGMAGAYSALYTPFTKEGALNEEMVIARLEAIARQARAGFVDGPGFPVFASINRNAEEGQ